MAFCKQCGTDMGDAKFCPNCGASTESITAVQQTPGADSHQRCLADFQHMMGYFGAKADRYKELDTVSAEVKMREEKTNGGWIVMAVISLLIGIFSKAVFFYIAVAGFVAGFVLTRKKNKDKLAIALAKQQDLTQELQQYYDDYGYCSISQKYTHPDILPELYDIVADHRAITPTDTINIYIADQKNNEMLKLQQEATAAAQETAIQAKKAAKASRKAAIYSGASFWFKR